MNNKLLPSILAYLALGIYSAAAEERIGTKACIVESARAFDLNDGASAIWSDAPKSFVLRVATCADVRSGTFSVDNHGACFEYVETALVIKTSLKNWEDSWMPAVPQVTQPGMPFDTIPVEFRSLRSLTIDWSGPILRLEPDSKFYFVQGGRKSGDKSGQTFMLFTLAGQCSTIE